MAGDIKSDVLINNIIEAAPDAMLVVNDQGQIIFLNRQAEKLFAYKKTELMGRDIECLIPERYLKQHLVDRAKYIKAPTLRPMGRMDRNLVARKNDGSEIPVDIMLSPTQGPNGLAFIATVRDATEKHKAELRLATSEAMFRSIYDHSPDAIIAVDKNGRITQFNQRAEELFRANKTDILDQPIEILLPDRYAKSHIAQRNSYIEKPRMRAMGAGLDLFAKRLDGTEFPVDIMLSPVEVPGNELVICVVRDVTDRKQAEKQLKERAEELKRSNQDLEQFAYVASHDLQEPLRAVAASCQVLQKRLAGKFDADTNEFIEFAIDGAKRMQALISDLLTYSRAGKSRSYTTVDLDKVMDTVKNNLQKQIQENAATIKYSLLPKIRGEFTQLVQVFQNLISNAIKFRGETSPEIAIDAKENSESWSFSVRDNGIGIAPEFKNKIFVIFQRLHKREEYPGTGIGLSVVKKIVESYGGNIELESKPGQGSTFYFTIPKKELST